MKKMLFSIIATIMISVSGFANSTKTSKEIIPIKSALVFALAQSVTIENRQIAFINYEDPINKTAVGCAECGPKGCCILTVIKDDGTVRSTETCCKNIIVVIKPSLSLTEE